MYVGHPTKIYERKSFVLVKVMDSYNLNKKQNDITYFIVLLFHNHMYNRYLSKWNVWLVACMNTYYKYIFMSIVDSIILQNVAALCNHQ